MSLVIITTGYYNLHSTQLLVSSVLSHYIYCTNYCYVIQTNIYLYWVLGADPTR